MTDRKLGILAVAAAVLLVLTVLCYSTSEKSGTSIKEGTVLVQGLEPSLVDSVVIKKEDSVTTLKKSEDGSFRIVEKDNYPASFKELNDLIRDITDIRIGSVVTDSAENHVELGVAEGGKDSLTVTFFDKIGKSLVGIVKGKSAEGASGAYIRLLGSDEVYATEDYLSLDSEASDFIEKNIFEVERDDVKEVFVKNKDEKAYIIKREGDKPALQNIPKGKRPHKTDFEDVFYALAGLNISDAKIEAGNNVGWDTTFNCKVKGELTYTVKLGKLKGKNYIKVSASVPPLKKVTAEEVKADTAEGTKKKDEMFQAADKAAEFTPRHSGWIYEVSDWDVKKMRKKFSELVEDKPASDEPEEVSAS
ncbi:MAG: DUF4340 domain-containing protein, partial [Planctomycetota bacterium]